MPEEPYRKFEPNQEPYSPRFMDMMVGFFKSLPGFANTTGGPQGANQEFTNRYMTHMQGIKNRDEANAFLEKQREKPNQTMSEKFNDVINKMQEEGRAGGALDPAMLAKDAWINRTIQGLTPTAAGKALVPLSYAASKMGLYKKAGEAINRESGGLIPESALEHMVNIGIGMGEAPEASELSSISGLHDAEPAERLGHAVKRAKMSALAGQVRDSSLADVGLTPVAPEAMTDETEPGESGELHFGAPKQAIHHELPPQKGDFWNWLNNQVQWNTPFRNRAQQAEFESTYAPRK